MNKQKQVMGDRNLSTQAAIYNNYETSGWIL